MAAAKPRVGIGREKAGHRHGRTVETFSRVLSGRATAVTPDGKVRFVSKTGRIVECRVPLHVSLAWLRAALTRAPVEAEATAPDGDRGGSLWSLFPGPEHEGVVPDRLELVASESVLVTCGSSKLSMKGRELRLRSRDVFVNGTRATRVRGGTVKVN
jgi:hypothetical protein